MEAPAVTASSPISGSHRHSSGASTTGDDEDGANSKLVIDLDGYSDRHGSYSPSEYYCYSVCDASSAADGMQVGGNTSSPPESTIAPTSCALGASNGNATALASLSESIESVVSAAAAFAGSRPAGGGRTRASPLASRPAQSFSSSHDPESQKKSPTLGGAATRRSPTATTSNACSRTGERSGTNISARNGTSGGENTRQQNNRNVTSAVTLENTCTTKIEGAVGGDGAVTGALSSASVGISLSQPIIVTTITTTTGEASSSVTNSASQVGSNKARRSAGSSSNKRSKKTNINNNSVSDPLSPSGVTEDDKRRSVNGMVNVSNMASNLDGQQNDSSQQNSSVASQQQSHSTPKSTSSLPRPSTLFKAKDGASPAAANSPVTSQQSPADDSLNATDAGLKMKIKRNKMATRKSAASHQVITDKQQRKRENLDEASSSSSSSTCASPAPATVARNSPLPVNSGGGKQRKSSSCSASGIRGLVVNSGAISPASSISSTSSTSANNQLQQHSSLVLSSSAVSTPSSPPSVNGNRSSPFVSTGAANATVSATVSSPITSVASQVAASDTIASTNGISEKANSVKITSKAAKQNLHETNSIATPPRKKCKIQQAAPSNIGNQPILECEQETKSISPSVTVFTPVLDKPKEKVEQKDAGSWVRTIGTATETECLGPCEPGTSVTLEGIVWQETPGGMLVINVTWRGKTYVGTLLDCTKYDWAPPRHCDSPSSENDSLAGFSSNGNGHRTPAKNGNGNGRGRKGNNRESKKQHQQQQVQQQTAQQQTEASASNGTSDQEANNNDVNASTSTAPSKDTKPHVEAILEPHSPIMFECPLGGCEKKYSAVVGLKYHQSSAHRHMYGALKEERQSELCQKTKKEAASKESATSPGLTPNEPARSVLEEAVAATTKLSPEERASLESLFKVAEQSRRQENQQESGKRAGSPAYSDISDDEALPSTISEHPSTAATSTVLHSGHGVEKPTAIVEPQPLASTVVALSADMTSSGSQSQSMTPMDCSPSALQHSPRGQKRSHSGTSKSPRDSKQTKERQPASAVVEPNTVRMTPPVAGASALNVSRSRSPDESQMSTSQSSMAIKTEPGSPRPPVSVQKFVAPAPPPSVQQQLPTGMSLPPHQSGQPQTSASVGARIPTPSSQLRAPSPASLIHHHRSPTPSQPSANLSQVPAPPSHAMNMINQMNHPAFMFNPFNPSSSMFHGGPVPPGVMPPSMGMDPTMAAAAALMAAGHPAAAMYAPPGSMAAAALAAAFPMGLSGPPPGSHPSVCYGFGPPTPSLAVSMAPGLPPGFMQGPNMGQLPPTGQPMQQPPSSPVATLQQQQQLHKIHELAEHAKRATPADTSSTPTPSVALPSSATINGIGSQKTSSSLDSSKSGKHQSSAPPAAKASPSGPRNETSSPHQGGGSGQKSVSGNVAESDSQLNKQLSSVQNSTADSKASSLGPLPSVSPPVQRHLHTHHHTHTYPTLLAPAIDPSYAAMVASQQAAAAAAAGVVGGFPTYGGPSKS